MPLLIPKDKMKKADKVPIDQSTEEKIKRAAEKVFLEKGYSASRTRDIAEEARYQSGTSELLFQE